MFPVILLAMIAAFLALRLYSVLGKRTGHEQPLKPAEERVAAAPPARTIDVTPETREVVNRNIAPPAEKGLRAIIAADPAFDVTQFLEGAQSAYRMVLEAFWKGDLEALRSHVDPHVYETFAAAVEQRQKDGLKLDNRLVAIDQTVISEANVDRSVALVTVRFEADIRLSPSGTVV